MLSCEEFKDPPPSQILPRLADKGRFVGSESTMYRLLHQTGLLARRRVERAPKKCSKPRALVAMQPDQIYCSDITYLPTQVRGLYFHLYLFVDILSRKVVGWQVFDRYVLVLRLERATQLLRSPTLKLVEAAHECGFTNQQHLSNTMRLHLGTTPSRYRQQLEKDPLP